MSSGLRLGALGLKTMFVRIPRDAGRAAAWSPAAAISRRRLGAAVRQKARWLGGIALRRLGPARLERRARRALDADARPARAARRPAARSPAYARRLAVDADLARRGARRAGRRRGSIPALVTLADDQRLAARLAGADARRLHHRRPTAWREGLLSIPRLVVGNLIAMLAARARAFAPRRRRRRALGQDPAHLPGGAAAMSAVAPLPRSRWSAGPAFARATLGMLPGRRAVPHRPASEAESAADRPDSVPTDSRRSSRVAPPPIAGLCRAYAALGYPPYGRLSGPAGRRSGLLCRAAVTARRHAAPAAAARPAAVAEPRAAILRADPAARRMAAVAHRVARRCRRRRSQRRRRPRRACPPSPSSISTGCS